MVSFAPTKAGRLVAFARSLVDRSHKVVGEYLSADRQTADLRADLMSLEGVGEETADTILLYAGRRPSFIVDAYARRAFQRLNLFPELGEAFWSQPYGRLKAFFETHLLGDLSLYAGFEFAPGTSREAAICMDYHAQLVELGRHHCGKSKPRCHSQGKRGWHNEEGFIRSADHVQMKRALSEVRTMSK